MIKGLVNVIIPVYNTEKYLAKCVDSIRSQTYKNIKILLVDDGSTDSCVQICRKYVQSDNRIKLIQQVHEGASCARNKGIEASEGEYVMFVDADDFLPDHSVIKNMVNAAEKTGSDIICGNYVRLMDSRLIEANRHGYDEQTDITKRNFRFHGFFSGGILSYVWCKLYRKQFLNDNQIRFADYRYAEDKLFNFQCYISGAVYGFTNKNVYVYRKNPDSISWKYREDSCTNWMQIIKNLDKQLKKRGLRRQYQDLEAYTLFFAMFFDSKMRYEFDGKKLSAVKGILKEYMNYPESKALMKHLANGDFTDGIGSAFWLMMIRGFSFFVNLGCYTLLAAGIKLLIDFKIDKRLSSTGKSILL